MFRKILISDRDNKLHEGIAFVIHDTSLDVITNNNLFIKDIAEANTNYLVLDDNLYKYDELMDKWFLFADYDKKEWFYADEVRQYALVCGNSVRQAKDGCLCGRYDLEFGLQFIDIALNVRRIDIYLNVAVIDLWRLWILDFCNYCALKHVRVVLHYKDARDEYKRSLVFDVDTKAN